MCSHSSTDAYTRQILGAPSHRVVPHDRQAPRAAVGRSPAKKSSEELKTKPHLFRGIAGPRPGASVGVMAQCLEDYAEARAGPTPQCFYGKLRRSDLW
jgi:hypothetical protein